MRTFTKTHREGELLGPIDWSYDFLSHFHGWSGNKEEHCREAIERLRMLTEGEWEATTDGGWPRCGWGKVIAVGMYDGWPYWKPTPSVAIYGTYGAEWACFSNIMGIRPAAGSVTSQSAHQSASTGIVGHQG